MRRRILTFFTIVDDKDDVEAISDNLDAFEEDEDANVDDRDAISAAAVDDADVTLGGVAEVGADEDVVVKHGMEAIFDNVDATLQRF